MKSYSSIAGVCLLSALLSGCAMYATGYDGRQHRGNHHSSIPQGHMPPPGECRIWYPDRPPGQQPPPGPCRELRHRVPAGAELIRG